MGRWIAEQRPDWPSDLRHVALGALALYRCRLSDVFLHEYALILHIIMGCGDELMRVHDGIPFFWNETEGVWHKYEGFVHMHIDA